MARAPGAVPSVPLEPGWCAPTTVERSSDGVKLGLDH